MSNPRQEIELAKRKPATQVEDILNIVLDKKSLHKFLSDLTNFSNKHREPNETAHKAFNRLFIETLPQNPTPDLLYRLSLLNKMELSKFANDLYSGARHNASVFFVNEKKTPKLSFEEIYSQPKLKDAYLFQANQIDKDAESLIAKNSKIQLIADTIYRRGEIQDQLKLLSKNQADFHACMNIILNFNEDISNLFPGTTNDQIKLEFDSFQTDFANDAIPDLRVFEVLDMVSSSVAVVYAYNPDENGLKLLENLKSGVEKFNDLLSPHLSTKADLSPTDRKKTQAYIGGLLEKDFFPNAQLRLLIAEVIKEIEQYGAKKRVERNIPKSDTALQFSADLKKLARQYFSLENKTEAAKVEFIREAKELVKVAKESFATTYAKKLATGNLLTRFKSRGDGPKLFTKVEGILAKIDSPKSKQNLSP